MDTSPDSGEWIMSEFSVHEFLYQHSDKLTWLMEELDADIAFDPFELVARLEEEFGMPIAFS